VSALAQHSNEISTAVPLLSGPDSRFVVTLLLGLLYKILIDICDDRTRVNTVLREGYREIKNGGL